MSLHEKAFWWSIFFIAGVLIGSFSETGWVSAAAGAAAAAGAVAVFLFVKELRFVPISLAILFGSSYYCIYSTILSGGVHIPFGERTVLTGVVEKASPGSGTGQYAVVSLVDPYRGKLRISLPRYPERRYGDMLRLTGTPERPEGTYRFRLEKDGIFGTMDFPDAALVQTNAGSPIFRALARAKEFSVDAMHRVLPPEKAAFLAGITLGETGEFSKEFREKFQETGTSHIVALSGYNIAVVANAAFLFFGFCLGRRRAMLASALAITGFVVMTGAEASVVRAAIMAGIVMLAESSRRIYSFRNAVTLAALAMVLANPRVLRWDLGFQLSFAAILGIVYLKPAIATFLRTNPKPGILGFKENFMNTISAEFAVFPILLMSFGSAPIIGLIVNLLVLAAIPAAMAVGFGIVAATLISPHLALVLGWAAEAILGYAIGIIDFFSRFSPQIKIAEFGIFHALIFYGAIVAFIALMNRRDKFMHR